MHIPFHYTTGRTSRALDMALIGLTVYSLLFRSFFTARQSSVLAIVETSSVCPARVR